MATTQLSAAPSQSDCESLVRFACQTKSENKAYSEHIRELYYSLLADQIPPLYCLLYTFCACSIADN